MSYRLLFFVGHFVHDGRFAAIQADERTRVALPQIRQPLDESDCRQSAVEFCDGDVDRVNNWDMKVENGQIAFCEFSDATAVAWILELARTKSLDVIEGGTMRVMPLSELSSIAA